MLSDMYFKLEFKQAPPIQINDHTPTCCLSSCTVRADFPKQQHMYSFILPYYAHKIVSESLPTSERLFLGLLEVKTDSSKISLPKINLLSKVHDLFEFFSTLYVSHEGIVSMLFPKCLDYFFCVITLPI